jgi:hypothetical protein
VKEERRKGDKNIGKKERVKEGRKERRTERKMNEVKDEMGQQ